METNIKAPAKREAKAMWLVEFVSDKDPEKTVTRQGFVEFGQITEDAITLTAMIEALSILRKPCKVHIYTKARGIYGTLEQSRNIAWRSQKWHKATGDLVKNAELWEILTRILETHEWELADSGHSFEKYMESEIRKWHVQ